MNPFRKIIDKNFHALTNSNYQYFWLGQCVSLIGTWMQSIGQTWLVYSLINSPLLLGVTNAIDMPARQSFMIEIAGREDLMNAIALNSVTFNLAKILDRRSALCY